MSEVETILGIDPGRSKCGLAILDNKKTIFYKNIVNTDSISSYLIDLVNKYNIDSIVLGNGTFNEEIYQKIEEVLDCPIHVIDESYTTLKAEQRFREENYRRWKRWLGFIKWKPSQAVDDYVAVILVEQFLEKRRTSGFIKE